MFITKAPPDKDPLILWTTRSKAKASPYQMIPDKGEIVRIVAQPYTTQEQILQNSNIPLDHSFVNVQMSFPL